MAHTHSHALPDGADVSRKLVVSTVATTLFVGAELGIGIFANSLALIGDAFHNFTDALALLLALLAIILQKRAPTRSKSFGYQRAGFLAAFVNAGTLVAFTVFILIEAWRRFRQPEPVDSFWMLVTAGVAIVLNSGITLWLRSEGKKDINIRGAAIHMMGDALSAVGIVIAAILMRSTGSTIYDPIVSVIIGVLILWSSWGVLRETVNLLLEGVPNGIDPDAVAQDIASMEGIQGVHHVHIWAIGPSRPALSCHLLLGDISLRTAAVIRERLNEMLAARYEIEHTTFQFEHAGCPEDNPYCLIYEDEDPQPPAETRGISGT
ncbi:MAG: cation diffusion facilitator family transporter [Thermoanaerobaculia bacterium]